MLIYLITSLPKLYIGEKPEITKNNLIKRVYEYIPESSLHDFKLLIKLDKDIKDMRSKFADMGGSQHEDKTIRKNSLLRSNLLYIYQNSHSNFLKLWARYSINVEDAIVGLVCKKKQLTKEHALEHCAEKFSLIHKSIARDYDSPDLGLSNRFSWFSKIQKVIDVEDFKKIEKTIDLVKLHIIDSIKPYDIFHMDILLAYYLELSILERQSSFDSDLGKKMLQKLLNSITVRGF